VSNLTLQQNAISQLAAQADAVGKLAEDTGAFAATFAAFESNDPDAFRWVLQRLELLPRCELICEWIRVKLCGLRCIEVCGPLDPKIVLPELPEFARALSQLASNEPVLRRVVDAVSCGDAESYQAAIADVKLQRFCHLICRYVCSIYYRRICEVVCTGLLVPVSDPVLDIRADAEAFSKVFENKDLSAAIGKAAIALDCGLLLKEIERAGFLQHCERICRVSCVWRSVWVCRALCLEPPVIFRGTYAVEEARNFALAARQLAGQPRALSDLTAAVISNNTQSFSAIVDRYRLGPYCWQVCGWVASEVCYHYCICVCPPPVANPVFTNIGYFSVVSDIDPATGKTNKGLPYPGLTSNGGPNFAFRGQLQLSGKCPVYSPAFPGVAMKYRFLYAIGGGSPAPIAANLVNAVVQMQAGTRPIDWPTSSGGPNPKAILPIRSGALAVQAKVVVWGSAAPPDPVAPAINDPYFDPIFYIQPDPQGWVTVDTNVLDGTFDGLLCFDTTQVPGLAIADPILDARGHPGGAPGIAVPPAGQKTGTDIMITFEATRVTNFPPGTTADYNQAPVKIRVNNWNEVNNLWFAEFAGQQSCCTPINDTLSVQFTVDHEEMDAGEWELAISSCSPSAPGQIAYQTVSSTLIPAGVTQTARGAFGTIVENTTNWVNCSYTVGLVTRQGLTDGTYDYEGYPNTLTFCICGH
jgi:hypothetical protein